MLVAGSGDATVVFENGLGGPLEYVGQGAARRQSVRENRHLRSRRRRSVGRGAARRGTAAALPPNCVARFKPPASRRRTSSLGRRSAVPTSGFSPGMYPDDVAGMVLVDPTPDTERADEAPSGLPELESLPDTLDQARASRVPTRHPRVPDRRHLSAGTAIRHRSDSNAADEATGRRSRPSRWNTRSGWTRFRAAVSSSPTAAGTTSLKSSRSWWSKRYERPSTEPLVRRRIEAARSLATCTSRRSASHRRSAGRR